MYCRQVTKRETGRTVNSNMYCEQSRCNVKALLRENQNVLYQNSIHCEQVNPEE